MIRFVIELVINSTAPRCIKESWKLLNSMIYKIQKVSKGKILHVCFLWNGKYRILVAGYFYVLEKWNMFCLYALERRNNYSV